MTLGHVVEGMLENDSASVAGGQFWRGAFGGEGPPEELGLVLRVLGCADCDTGQGRSTSLVLRVCRALDPSKSLVSNVSFAWGFGQ